MEYTIEQITSESSCYQRSWKALELLPFIPDLNGKDNHRPRGRQCRRVRLFLQRTFRGKLLTYHQGTSYSSKSSHVQSERRFINVKHRASAIVAVYASQILVCDLTSLTVSRQPNTVLVADDEMVISTLVDSPIQIARLL
jgi:hypothetical protein